jgi:NADP-dependent 3-hydroxy acid dehydrogenase YdfG
MKTAIIFGHTSGLGLAIAERLQSDGYKVVGVARSQLADDLPGVEEIAVDLTDETALISTIQSLRLDYPHFDVLVYSAAVLTAHDLGAVDYRRMEYLYRLNLFAPMLIESRLLDLIAQNGADVVNVTSSSLQEYYPQFTEYATAKVAFSKFTDDLRRRLEPTSARVIELCPSGFTSSLYQRMLGERIPRDESKQMSAVDLAELVSFVLALPKIVEVAGLSVNRKPVPTSDPSDS